MQVVEQTSLWDSIMSDFQGLFPHDVYRTWFENLELISQDGDSFVLGVPNEFSSIWIQDNYHDVILQRIQLLTGHSAKVSYKVKDSPNVPSQYTEAPKKQAPPKFKPKIRKDNTEAYLINPKNTFENFVVGLGNQMAHAACVAVANAPARAYNPLFLYGETGLGKTHLMHAVAHYVLRDNPDTTAAYISTEKFTNEFIRAIQENSVASFRKRYRQVDILLIDDIHFLSGKERIQEEFFHTFNDLFEAQKQIILCSDRPASEIAKLEKRLVSRFQWGMVTDIQAPDLETRMAILNKKAQAMGLDLPEQILQFLAERVSKNVRRMEGALTRVAGYVQLVKSPLTVDIVENLLKDILQEEAMNRVTVEKIQKKVTEHFNLRTSDMQSKRRPANIALPRQIAMYLCRVMTHESLQNIGEAFGGRDHGTVMHACKTVENLMSSDETTRRNVEYLTNQLSSRS